MVALLAAFAIAFQVPSPFPDRAKFLQALKALPDRAPKADVLKALGKPDRIENRTVTEGSKTIADETWFYGTDGSAGAATLARFEIFDGELAYHPVFEDSPAPSVISEVELRKGMHIVLNSIPLEQEGRLRVSPDELSAWLAKTVNGLLPYGDAKCKAIVSECGRLLEGYAELNPCPYFLCDALFDPPKAKDDFWFQVPVWVAPMPKDGKEHPGWPVEIIDNVPIVRGEPLGGFGGTAVGFSSDFAHVRDMFRVRKSPLSFPK